MKELLENALSPRSESPDVLAGVQRKLRERSQGKFYGDRWTTEKHPPANTYLITSLLMLALCAITYVVLRPFSETPKRVTDEPAGVKVVAPAPVLPSPAKASEPERK